MHGLVLEGGGARGAYHIGAWKALRELGLTFKGVAGTSVGALNGAMILQDNFEIAYEMWQEMTPSKILDVEDDRMNRLIKLELNGKDIKYLIKGLKELFENMGFNISPLKKLLHENIDEQKIRNSKKDFGMVTICLTDRKPLELFIEDIPKGELINYLIASSSLPVFKKESFGGKVYLDGGFYNNIPINLLASKGYKDIIAVRLYRNNFIKKAHKNLNITYIEPSEDLCPILDFSSSSARYNINLGYFDTYKIFHDLRGKKYYIKPQKEEGCFVDYFNTLDKETVEIIGDILGIPPMPYRRMLFEHIIPKLVELLDIDKNSTYEDIVFALYERAAENYGVERFKIYSFEDLEDKVLEKFNPSRGKSIRRLPRILKERVLVRKTLKDDILKEIIDNILLNLSWISSI